MLSTEASRNVMGHLKVRIALAVCAIALSAAGCATAPRDVAKPAPSPHFKVGKPYKINGRWYRPAVDTSYDEKGVASWYGADFHGRPTANGEIYDMRQMTAAHTTLPMPSLVEVTNLENGRRTVVRVNDRGPFAKNRIIDLSRAAARVLGFEKQGLAKVRVRYLAPAPLPGEKAEPVYANTKPAAQSPVLAAATSVGKTNADQLAALIGDADPGREPNLPPPLPEMELSPVEPPLYAVQVAVLDNIEELPALRASLADEGPLRIARAGVAPEASRYRINLGPFPSESEATDRLETVREAGYDNAVIIVLAP